MGKPNTIEAYLDALPDEVRPIVEQVGAAIRAGLPGHEERFRYDMPAVMLDDRHALHYAGWKQHIGLYPVSPLPAKLETEVSPYRTKKDSVTFKYKDGVPYDLIERIAAALGSARRAG